MSINNYRPVIWWVGSCWVHAVGWAPFDPIDVGEMGVGWEAGEARWALTEKLLFGWPRGGIGFGCMATTGAETSDPEPESALDADVEGCDKAKIKTTILYLL